MAGRRGGDSAGHRVVEMDRSAGGAGGSYPGRYVAVAGNMGSGKSSLVAFLCRRYDIEPFFEPNDDNPYLEDFYRDMPRWSLASQSYFLGAKLRMHRDLAAHPGNVIQDRTIWEDAEIFARSLHAQRIMSDRDWATYRQLYEAVRDTLRPPDLLIYLRCSVAAARRRIASRGRPMERDLPVSYLSRLHRLYESWTERYRLSPVLIVPSDRMDHITDLVDCHQILSAIDKHLS